MKRAVMLSTLAVAVVVLVTGCASAPDTSAAGHSPLADMNRRGELAKYRFLLFSTHGYLSLAHPMLSAIVLRQPGQPAMTDT